MLRHVLSIKWGIKVALTLYGVKITGKLLLHEEQITLNPEGITELGKERVKLRAFL